MSGMCLSLRSVTVASGRVYISSTAPVAAASSFSSSPVALFCRAEARVGSLNYGSDFTAFHSPEDRRLAAYDTLCVALMRALRRRNLEVDVSNFIEESQAGGTICFYRQ